MPQILAGENRAKMVIYRLRPLTAGSRYPGRPQPVDGGICDKQ
jgi:hypothetical protein